MTVPRQGNDYVQVLNGALAGLGSTKLVSQCLAAALRENRLRSLPEERAQLREFVADALRVHLEMAFGRAATVPAINTILDKLGTPPRQRKATIDRSQRLRRMSAMITLPPASTASQNTVEFVTLDPDDGQRLTKLMTGIAVRRHDSIEAARAIVAHTDQGTRTLCVVDAKNHTDGEALASEIRSLAPHRTLVWGFGGSFNDTDAGTHCIRCEKSVELQDIATLLRIAFFSIPSVEPVGS